MARRRAKKNGALAVAGGVLGGVALTGVALTAAVLGGGYWFLVRPITKTQKATRAYLQAAGYKLADGKVKQSLKGDGWHVTTNVYAEDGSVKPITLWVDKKTFAVSPLLATQNPNWGWRIAS